MMDHYIPKRRVPVTLWSSHLQGVAGAIFLDLDASGVRHQTILEKLNESTPFLPAAVGGEGLIHLFNKARLVRVTPGRQVLQSDVFARGFQPWREEEAEIVLTDGLTLQGKVWMPLQRQSQRLSDYMNQQGAGFIVVLTSVGPHLIHPAGVVEMRLAESAGAPIAGVGGSEPQVPVVGGFSTDCAA
jgi:hypothetical protein